MQHPMLTIAVRAARKAGNVIAKHYETPDSVETSQKGSNDFVTNVDKAAEAIIIETIRKSYPQHTIITEESGEHAGEDQDIQWVIDPLDGTTNFLHGIPVFAVSIALERQGQIVAGVIYNPAMDELYTAERGGGAFLNDRRLRVAARNKLVDCVIGTGIQHLGRPGHGHYLVELRNVMGETAGIRRMGAVALDLAYVAAGRLDGFWEDGMHPWDLGAGMLMIREAGGFVSDKKGGQDIFGTKTIVAGNEIIQKALLKTVNKPI